MGSLVPVLRRSLESRQAQSGRKTDNAPAGDGLAGLGLQRANQYDMEPFRQRSTSEMLNDALSPEAKLAMVDARYRLDKYFDAGHKSLPRPPGYVGDKPPSIARPTPQGLSASELEIARGELLQDAAIGGPPSLAAYAATRNLPLNKTEAAVNAGMAINDMMTGSRSRGERPPSRPISPKSVMAPYKSAATSDDFRIFFHGAPSKSFWNILLKGIDLSKTRELNQNIEDPSKRIHGNDFGPGFYMDRSAQGALQSGGRHNVPHDLLEFIIPRWELEKLKHKQFDGPDAEWAKFVIENKARKAPGEPRPRAYDVDMITGPMYHKKVAGKVLPISDRGNQTSIHTAEAAKIFNKYRRRG